MLHKRDSNLWIHQEPSTLMGKPVPHTCRSGQSAPPSRVGLPERTLAYFDTTAAAWSHQRGWLKIQFGGGEEEMNMHVHI